MYLPFGTTTLHYTGIHTTSGLGTVHQRDFGSGANNAKHLSSRSGLVNLCLLIDLISLDQPYSYPFYYRRSKPLSTKYPLGQYGNGVKQNLISIFYYFYLLSQSVLYLSITPQKSTLFLSGQLVFILNCGGNPSFLTFSYKLFYDCLYIEATVPGIHFPIVGSYRSTFIPMKGAFINAFYSGGLVLNLNAFPEGSPAFCLDTIPFLISA